MMFNSYLLLNLGHIYGIAPKDDVNMIKNYFDDISKDQGAKSVILRELKIKI